MFVLGAGQAGGEQIINHRSQPRKGIHMIYVLIWTIAIITEDSRSVGLATHSHEFASYEACQAAKERLSKTKPLLSSFSQFEITADCYAKGPAPAQSPN